jgi:hypothetical protein
VTGLPGSPAGILGNLNFNGSLDVSSAIVSGGMIGDAALGTVLSASNIKGLVAANGSINPSLTGANIFANQAGTAKRDYHQLGLRPGRLRPGRLRSQEPDYGAAAQPDEPAHRQPGHAALLASGWQRARDGSAVSRRRIGL